MHSEKWIEQEIASREQLQSLERAKRGQRDEMIRSEAEGLFQTFQPKRPKQD